MVEQLADSFGVLLRRLRKDAHLTQEELAQAAGLSPRTVSDLERGLTLKTHRTTARLLADALNLEGPVRAEFEAAARGHGPAGGSAVRATGAETRTGTADDRARADGDPQAWLDRVVAALDGRGVAAARSVVSQWRDRAEVDPAWLAWVDGLIRLTSEGRLQPAGRRPLPASGTGSFHGRDREAAELNAFLDRVQHGRGGLALVDGPAGIGKSRLLVEVLAGRLGGAQVEWVTLDRDEAGYRGWRRLLAPLWVTLRRGELAPAGLLAHAGILDDILLVGRDGDLTGRLFPGEVAAAVAVLLDHAAARQPLVLVIDDAHRGGASSDHLLIDVARRMSARGVGVIAALRQDELEQNSPIRHYGDQADGRAAQDVVVPIHVPPLDPDATAGLLRERTGAEPPPEIVEQVLRQTGGRPQLINNTHLQAPVRGAAASAWVVGKLDTAGLRVLESTIQSRLDGVRDVLRAAALCAVGGYFEPGPVARVAGVPADVTGRILDEEGQRGPILTPQMPGYRFQHDNWIDALIAFCPPARLRALHARCLALLQAEPAPDPQRLARHAIGAGAELVGADTVLALAREAGDLAFADYAFGPAAEWYEAAAHYSAERDRIDLLIARADALRFRGGWHEARDVLRVAVSLARGLRNPGQEAMALVRLERLTWSYGLDEKEMARQFRDVISRLPPDEVVLRAQAQAALALRLAVSGRLRDNEQADLATTALRELPSVPEDSLARADIILGIRGGLQDSVPVGELLDYDQQMLDLGVKLRSAFHIGEALIARVIDLIRAGRLLELPAAVRAHREFAEQSAAPVVIYAQALIDAMLALARGDFRAAGEWTAEAARLSEAWGESYAREALMAQSGWLLYETGQVEGLTEVLAELPEQEVSTLNEPVWSLGAGLIHAEQGNLEPASRALREVGAATGDFGDLPRGPSRIGILATAAMLLGHPLLCDALPSGEAVRWGRSLAGLLNRHQDTVVLAGWPAVMLGSKHRYIGLAHLAARQPAKAARHLARAASENSDFAVLRTRTRFDLARALIRQPAVRSQGMTEMERAEQAAADLGMTNLAAQAAAELDLRSRPGRSSSA